MPLIEACQKESRLKSRVDLHLHSTASDGTSLPAELPLQASQAGLSIIALTDHDTVDGVPEFLAACDKAGLKGFAGVEISLEHENTLHLLGLNVAELPEVPKPLIVLKRYREERNQALLDKLSRLGYHIDYSRLLELAAGGVIGRPHFARALIENGYFSNLEDVFGRLLAKGQPGYLDKKRLSPVEGLAAIRESGWAPVLAHPNSLGLLDSQWPDYVAFLKKNGLLGLEVYHPSHCQARTVFFKKLARRFNLISTAGSDFHGGNKPAIKLNWVRRHSPIGHEVIELLKEALKR